MSRKAMRRAVDGVFEIGKRRRLGVAQEQQELIDLLVRQGSGASLKVESHFSQATPVVIEGAFALSVEADVSQQALVGFAKSRNLITGSFQNRFFSLF
jgi:hypothetical protein